MSPPRRSVGGGCAFSVGASGFLKNLTTEALGAVPRYDESVPQPKGRLRAVHTRRRRRARGRGVVPVTNATLTTHVGRKDKAAALTPPDLNTYDRAVAVSEGRSQDATQAQTGGQKREPQIHPRARGQGTSDKGVKITRWGKEHLQ